MHTAEAAEYRETYSLASHTHLVHLPAGHGIGLSASVSHGWSAKPAATSAAVLSCRVSSRTSKESVYFDTVMRLEHSALVRVNSQKGQRHAVCYLLGQSCLAREHQAEQIAISRVTASKYDPSCYRSTLLCERSAAVGSTLCSHALNSNASRPSKQPQNTTRITQE